MNPTPKPDAAPTTNSIAAIAEIRAMTEGTGDREALRRALALYDSLPKDAESPGREKDGA